MTERVAQVATGISYTIGGSATFFGALTTNEFVALGGLFIGTATLFINWYYRHKHFKLAVLQNNSKVPSHGRKEE